MNAMLLDQLIGAMDAADEYNAGKRARVEIVLRHGAMVARVIKVENGEVALVPNVVERMIGLDMLEVATWPATAAQIVEDALNAL